MTADRTDCDERWIDRTRYESHEWTGNEPDYCARCGVDWDDADITCEEEIR